MFTEETGPGSVFTDDILRAGIVDTKNKCAMAEVTMVHRVF